MKRKRTTKTDYQVGFGKPPVETQFQKGVSGNPSGGRKKPATMPEVLRGGLGKTIKVLENGKQKTITKLEAVVNRLIDKSIVGDMTASRLLLMLAQVLSDSPTPSAAELEEMDQKVLQSLFETHSAARSE